MVYYRILSWKCFNQWLQHCRLTGCTILSRCARSRSDWKTFHDTVVTAQRPAILTEFYHVSTQSFQINARILLPVTLQPLPYTYIFSISLLTIIWCCVVGKSQSGWRWDLRNKNCISHKLSVKINLQVVHMHMRLAVNGVFKNFLKKGDPQQKVTCCIKCIKKTDKRTRGGVSVLRDRLENCFRVLARLLRPDYCPLTGHNPGCYRSPYWT